MLDDKHAESPDTPPVTTTRSSGRRRWLAGGMVGVMLAAVLLGGTAFAQSGTDGDDQGPRFVERLAEKLGISSDDLEAKIDETRNDMIDDAVANGRLTERQAERLRDRSFVFLGGFQFGGGGFGLHVARHLDIDLATIADELGITTDELRAEIEAGSTLSEIIEAHGSSIDAVVAALVEAAEPNLAEAVENGRLTQEQADQILANLPERLTQMLERDFPGDCAPWFNQQPDDSATPDTTDAEQTSDQV